MRPDDEAPAVAAFSGSGRRSGRAKAQPARRRARPPRRPPAGRATGRGRARTSRGCRCGRALLQGDHRRRRSLRRCRQAAGRVLRGARQRRLGGAGGGVAIRSRGRPARHRRRRSGATSARPRVRTPPHSSSRAAPIRRSPTRSPSTRTSAPIRSIRSSPPAATTAPASSCLVRTSNAGGRDLQEAVLSDGTTVWRHVAGLVAEWGADLVGERGMSSVGAVVGATVPRVIGDARRAMPQAIILLPGRRRPGRDPGRRRPRLHERAGERARQRVALGDLRLPRRRGRLACGRREPRRPGSAAEIWAASGW